MLSYTSKEMKRFNHLLGVTHAVYHEISLKMGLSDSAMNILYTICDNGDSCPLHEICRLSGLSKQTVNSAIRKLEADGILYLKPVGGRNKDVCLTDAGKALAGRTAIRIIRAENEIFASWPKADIETYLELTEKFLVEIRKKAAEL